MNYKVLITTSGLGKRLGQLIEYTNKSLVRVGKRPVISYIIESYPNSTEYVITLGYFGDQVKDFLELAYPDRKFSFVKVDKYQGKGSSLLYSMLRASHLLQCPFIFHACDTLVKGDIPQPVLNWNGGFKGKGSSQYSSFDVMNGRVQKIYRKGMLKPDYLHIGLVGINDYLKFWEIAKRIIKDDPYNDTLNDVVVIDGMLKSKCVFKAVSFNKWYDVGNLEGLNFARQSRHESFYVLDKLGEATFFFDKFVIKFFNDTKKVKYRLKRANVLQGLVPEIVGTKKNFYKYKYVRGDLLSEVANRQNFSKLLFWAKKKLWKKSRETTSKRFKEICYGFYHDKTLVRLNDFYKTRSICDTQNNINGLIVPRIREMFKQIDWKLLSESKQSKFHGDFILDNILKTRSGYCLLDWRQDFGGLVKAGDVYYDLAKLNHNLIINHEIVIRNLFEIKVKGKEIFCEILRKNSLVDYQKFFWDFVEKNNFSVKKIKILTALIWLNMSPLHTHPFDLFLFYFGKYNLWKELNEN